MEASWTNGSRIEFINFHRHIRKYVHKTKVIVKGVSGALTLQRNNQHRVIQVKQKQCLFLHNLSNDKKKPSNYKTSDWSKAIKKVSEKTSLQKDEE